MKYMYLPKYKSMIEGEFTMDWFMGKTEEKHVPTDRQSQGGRLMKECVSYVILLALITLHGTCGLSHAQVRSGEEGTAALPKEARLEGAGGQGAPATAKPAQTTATKKDAVQPGSIQVIIDGQPVELTDDGIDEVIAKLGARYKRKPAENIQLQTPISLQNVSGQAVLGSADIFAPKVVPDVTDASDSKTGWLSRSKPKLGISEAIKGLNLDHSPYWLEPGAATGSTHGTLFGGRNWAAAQGPGYATGNIPGYAVPAGPSSTEVYLNQQVLDLKTQMQSMSAALENMRLQTKAILATLKSQEEILKSLKPTPPPGNSK